MRIRSLFQRGISLILTLAILITTMSGCVRNTPTPSNPVDTETINPTIDTDAIADQIFNDLLKDATNSDVDVQPLLLSNNWEDYVGDIETFVYGLLTHQLEYKYEVFPASFELSDGTEIYGLAYTDYSECYTDENEAVAYFSAGMLTFVGEPPIPKDEFEKGSIVENLDYQDDQFGFLLKYATDEFTEHCVVFNQYLKYGVNSFGQISYSVEEYVKGNCDESLGSLYSYDEGKYLLDLDIGEYTPVSGVSLASQIDFDLLEAEINKILETQEVNFAQIDIESNLYFAQEAVSSYLLSLQEETFLGYDVDVLIDATKELDPMECLQMSPEGILTIDIDELPGEEASALAKWLVGTTCVIVTAVGMVGSTVFMMCPPLSSAASAVTGAAIDVFMQVVVSGQALEYVDWGKVALSSVTGAVTGFLGPYVMAVTGGVGYFFADSAIDALMGGIEHTVIAWMDGADGTAMLKSFGYGFVLGFGLSAGFKAAGELISELGKGVGWAVNKTANAIAPKLTTKVSTFFSQASGLVLTKAGKAFATLQEAANSTPFYSKYIANAMAFRQLAKLVNGGMDDLTETSLANLTKNGLVDPQGNPLTKDALRKMVNDAKDGDVIAILGDVKDGVSVVKRNGIVGIEFDSDQYLKVNITRIVDDRDVNFKAAAEKIKSEWIAAPETVPASISNAIRQNGDTVQSIDVADLVAIFKTRSNGFVLHENIDMQTISLVPRTLHDTIEGGYSHLGGYSLAKYVKAHMGSAYLERFLAAASSGMVTAAG